VAGAVNEKGAVLQGNDARDPGQEKGPEGAAPPVPSKAKQGRKNKAHPDSNPLDIAILPDNEAIALQVRHIVVRFGGIQFENEPANVGEEEAFRNAVGIIIVIDVLVMAAMFAGPHQNRVFKSGRAKEEGEEPHRPRRLESDVREEPVIAQADAEPARQEHEEKKRNLKPVEPEMPEVEWNRGESEREGADEKRTGRPVDAMDWKTGHHIIERSAVTQTAGGATSIRPELRRILTIARFMPLPNERFDGRNAGQSALARIRERSLREEINAIEGGDDFTASEQFFQIVAMAELFVAEDALPKIRAANPGVV
jgi:hypothetical protein